MTEILENLVESFSEKIY